MDAGLEARPLRATTGVDTQGRTLVTRFRRLFGDVKPIIAMVHVGATPGAPLHHAERGVEGIIADVSAATYADAVDAFNLSEKGS